MTKFKWNIRTVVLLLGIALMMFALVGCGGTAKDTGGEPVAQNPDQPKLEVTSLKVGLPVPAATFLPLYLADSKGYFKDEGLSVELFTFGGDGNVVQALAGGSIDINVASMSGFVNAVNGRQPFKAFWGGFNQADIYWYSPTLTSMDDAKGKRFGITTYGSLTDFLTRYALRLHGLDPEKDVQIIQVGPSINAIPALETGQIDVSTSSTPARFVMEELGMHQVMSVKEDISPTWVQHIVYARERFIDNNPETIKAFLRAMVRGIELIENNPEEAAKELMSRLNYSENHANRSIEPIVPYYDKAGNIDPQGLKLFWNIAIDAGDVKEAWTNDKWLNSTFINSANEWLK
ncbi:MAG: ABC transporter substrate-binding protein [Clostridia bacterium]|jgi:NitT/TauT family transport system substrate-binding protein|nr:ABC transporter substrate-binding protein [Clostridia bacterium]